MNHFFNFAERFRAIIDEYNAGGAQNDDFYKKIIDFMQELKEEENSPEVIKYDRVNGPHDIEEVTAEDLEDYVDLGALRIKLLDGMNLRLETDDATGAGIGVVVASVRWRCRGA